jgi:hypothetical protein
MPLKQFLKIQIFIPLLSIFISSCSNSKSEIIEKFNSIETRYPLLMSFDGCNNSITEKNSDTESRKAQLQMVSLNLVEAFKFLNAEIEYINSIPINEENADVMNEYHSKISSLYSEHFKIFRLVFVEGAKNNTDYWGKLSLTGENYDILKQVSVNKTQKSIIDRELNNLTLMRFKKVVMISSGEKIEEREIPSPLDEDLTPIKMQ